MNNNPYVYNNANNVTANDNTDSTQLVKSGFWKRFVAAFIDGAILSIPSFAIGEGFSFGFTISMGISTILGAIYFPVFESSIMNATPGKSLMGLMVLTETGGTLTPKAAFIRFFCRYLSSIICYVGYIMQVFTSKRQTLHDMISESIVVDKKSSDVNYFSVWKNQFKFILEKL